MPGNVRLLEGALTRVIALASVFSEPIDRSLVRKALSEPGAGEGESKKVPGKSAVIAPSVAAIQESVCSVLGVAPEQLRSSSRIPRVSRARQLSMYLAREMTPLSLTQIAREFGRDHSTVIASIRAVEGRLEPGSETLDDLHNARRSLAGYVDYGSGGRSDPTAADLPNRADWPAIPLGQAKRTTSPQPSTHLIHLIQTAI